MATRLFVMTVSVGFWLSVLSCGFVQAQDTAPEEPYVQQLKAIHVTLTELGKRKERTMKEWLEDDYTGYPDLLKVLLRSITPPVRTQGPLLPLDVIEGWCRKNRGKDNEVIGNHTSKEVREAYRQTWLERNSTSGKPSIEEILEGRVTLIPQGSRPIPQDRTKVLQELTNRHLTLTIVPGKTQRMWKFSDSPDSGYPDLLKVLFKAIPRVQEDKVKGPLLPLDVLEVWCRKLRKKQGRLPDVNTVIYDHTEEEIRKAYVETWYGLNSDPRDLTYEQIRSGQ